MYRIRLLVARDTRQPSAPSSERVPVLDELLPRKFRRPAEVALLFEKCKYLFGNSQIGGVHEREFSA